MKRTSKRKVIALASLVVAAVGVSPHAQTPSAKNAEPKIGKLSIPEELVQAVQNSGNYTIADQHIFSSIELLAKTKPVAGSGTGIGLGGPMWLTAYVRADNTATSWWQVELFSFKHYLKLGRCTEDGSNSGNYSYRYVGVYDSKQIWIMLLKEGVIPDLPEAKARIADKELSRLLDGSR